MTFLSGLALAAIVLGATYFCWRQDQSTFKEEMKRYKEEGCNCHVCLTLKRELGKLNK